MRADSATSHPRKAPLSGASIFRNSKLALFIITYLQCAMSRLQYVVALLVAFSPCCCPVLDLDIDGDPMSQSGNNTTASVRNVALFPDWVRLVRKVHRC